MSLLSTLAVVVRAQGVERTNRQLDSVDKTGGRAARSVVALEQRFSKLDNTLGDFNRVASFARNIIGLLRWPSIIAGAGMAAQAVGALAAGAVALSSALAPLAGGLAAYAAGAVAAGQAVGVFKLATMGLQNALKAASLSLDGTKSSAKAYHDQLKTLTAPQRTFVEQVRGMLGQMRGLRSAAAAGVLPGVTAGLQAAMRNFGRLRPIVASTGQVFSDLARSAGNFIGSASFGRDLAAVGRTNTIVIRNLGNAAMALGVSFVDVVATAQPLIRWMSVVVRNAAQGVNAFIAQARASGQLAG
jgi:hypothetical protein